MASKEEVRKRKEKLISILDTADDKSMLVKDLIALLEISERSFQKDQKELKEEGTIISVKNGVATLIERKEVVSQSSPAIMRQIKVLMLLGSYVNGLTKKEILQKIIADSGDLDYETDDLIKKKEVRRKRLESDLQELIAQNLIYSKKEQNVNCIFNNSEEDKYFISMNSQVVVRRKDTELLEIYKKLVDDCNQNSYGDILLSITQKIYDAINSKLYSEEIKRIEPIVVQNFENEYEKYEKILKLLFSINYKSKKIKIEYSNRFGTPGIVKTFSLGNIVFLADVGKFYLLGKCKEDGEKCVLIELSRVYEITELSEENEEFGLEFYDKICEEMFRISTEDSTEVITYYEPTISNFQMIKRTMNSRKTCKYEMNEKRIICSDTIRGVQDYTKFLRKYGNEVIVVSPISISKQMRKSAERVIERYENNE